MATYWTRAIVPTICGSCGAVIEPGSPMLVRKLPQVNRARFRGGCCVDAPPDLPADPPQGDPIDATPPAQQARRLDWGTDD